MMAVQDTQYTQKKWETGIFCCCCSHGQSGNQCCFFCGTLFCQPCAQGILQEHAGLADDCCGPCCFYSLCSSTALGVLVPCISLFNLRRSLTEKANIGEGCLWAFIKVLCCFPCAMSQMNNQFVLGKKEFKAKGSGCGKCMSYVMGCVGDVQLGDALQRSTSNTMQGVEAPSPPNYMSDVVNSQQGLIVFKRVATVPVKGSRVQPINAMPQQPVLTKVKSVPVIRPAGQPMLVLPQSNAKRLVTASGPRLRMPRNLSIPPQSVFPQQ
jgi:hypothetical protein